MATKADIALRKLVMAVEKHPELLVRLCADPPAVAKEFGVTLAEGEVAQLKRVGELRRLLDEFTAARIPGYISYPIDRWWSKVICYPITFYGLYPLPYHTFYGVYPVPYWILYRFKHRFGKTVKPAAREGIGSLRTRTRGTR